MEQQKSVRMTTNSSPIIINGNDDFRQQARVNGWLGDGSRENPYLLENLYFEGMSGTVISISDTSVFFYHPKCYHLLFTWTCK